MKRPCVLVFAGVDPSGGAGIAADIEAIGAAGAHPLTVITALTVQDNDRVQGVHPVAPSLIRQQAEALIDKIPIAAVKIGIVANRANAEAIAAIVYNLRQTQPALPVVFDPVLGSGHGDALSADDPVEAIAPLFTVATLATPNLVEAARLCNGEADIDAQAQMLLARSCPNILIKGGHAMDGDQIINRWYCVGEAGNERTIWRWNRLAGAFHGSGCTLASAIAARLAAADTLPDALLAAQAYTQRTLESAYAIASGQGIPERRIAFASRQQETMA